jgi:hypothetical protein
MKMKKSRLKSACKAMAQHFAVSLLVALIVAALVFCVWFPHPFRSLAGGTELFFLIIGVDIVCGPLLTLVIFDPSKPKRELLIDLSLVILLQLTAFWYGVWTVQQARPLYLVHETDRFKVIALADVNASELANVSDFLMPQIFKGPQIVGLRNPSNEEREKVMFESVQGGRDYAERPNFYAPYDAATATKAYKNAKPIVDFVKKYPHKQNDIDKIKLKVGDENKQLRYLPIVARRDWVAVLNLQGVIVGYIEGDGF